MNMKKIHRFAAGVTAVCLTVGCAMPAFAAADPTRDETVFIILNADGSVQKQTSSVWLHSDSGLSGAEDKASLDDPRILKGDWKLEQNGDVLKFEGDGKDIYYQGETKKTPPVTAQIEYLLDGQSISAEDLVGKDGHVTIRIHLENNCAFQRTVGGKQRTVYTPYAVALAVNLPVGTFENIKADKGMVQTDSLNQVAAFVALPGMHKNFEGLIPNKMNDLYDYMLDDVVVEADVKDFKMPDIMGAVASSLEQLDTDLPDGLNEFDEMQEKLDDLKEATKKLQDGAAKLADATGELKNGAEKLDNAVGSLKTGAGDLNNGAAALADGAAALVDGSNKVAEGAAGVNSLLGQVCDKNATLNGGANALFAAVVDGAEAQLNQSLTAQGMDAVDLTPDNYAAVINGIIAGMGEENIYAKARAQVEQQVYTDENRAKATQMVTANFAAVILVKQQAGAAGVQLTDEQAQQKAAELLATEQGRQMVAAAMAKPEMQAVLGSMQDAINATVETQLAAKVEEALAPGGAAYDALQQALAQASAASAQLNGVLASLGQAQAFVQGVASYTDAVAQIYTQGTQPLAAGAAQAKDGAAKLKNGAAALKDGTGTLLNGANQLKDGTKTLLDGAVQLAGGAGELSSGVNEYASEGIDKMTDSIEDLGLDSLSDMFDVLEDLAEDNQSYTGSGDNEDSSVRFMLKVVGPDESKAAAEAAAQAEAEAQPQTFWQRVKALFTK